jgi:two-component system cell cycle sensor histidine kinase/response regulator CckA
MSIPLHVLLVEDSQADAALITHELCRGNYEINVERIVSSAAMTAALQKRHWDLVISDYTIPGFSGIEALKLLRASGSDIPFIFVSGTIGEERAVTALKLGAQDYVMKDNLTRLLPTIERELQEAAQRRERVRLEQENRRLQKYEAIGRLAGGIAHDFNNALGVILGWAQLGSDEAPDGSPLQKRFQTIIQQARRSAGLTAQLLAFARRQVIQARYVDLNCLVSETTSLLKSVIGEQIDLKLSLAWEQQIIWADPTQVEQLLVNICLNARDAMEKGGDLLIQTQAVNVDDDFTRVHSYAVPGRYVLLSISDTGIGMNATTLDHIFEPFFTTKENGKGTGLGLASVYGIVKQHSGFVNVYSELGCGTTFHVYLPASSGAPEARPVLREEKVTTGCETILVAEDYEELRDLARVTLESQGYRVILAADGSEAVRRFQENSEEIRLALLDVVMPILSGPEAYCQMSAIRPDLLVIFTSGHTGGEVARISDKTEGGCFLPKPYSPQILAQAVRSVLDRQ